MNNTNAVAVSTQAVLPWFGPVAPCAPHIAGTSIPTKLKKRQFDNRLLFWLMDRYL
jgi:hypothetical protein